MTIRPTRDRLVGARTGGWSSTKYHIWKTPRSIQAPEATGYWLVGGSVDVPVSAEVELEASSHPPLFIHPITNKVLQQDYNNRGLGTLEFKNTHREFSNRRDLRSTSPGHHFAKVVPGSAQRLGSCWHGGVASPWLIVDDWLYLLSYRPLCRGDRLVYRMVYDTVLPPFSWFVGCPRTDHSFTRVPITVM